jgi:LysM repeat protein
MNPDLLSANVSLAFLAVVAIAMLAHLSQLAGEHRLLNGLYAATAAGLVYLFGSKALGWSFLPREALFALYAGLFVVVAGLALLRRGKDGDIPWIGLLIEQAAMAYIFAPLNYWKPPLSALLLLYFLLELFNWLKGREEAVANGAEKDHRPPLFPPKRVRGAREFAAAAAAAALVYVFAMGVNRAPIAGEPEAQAKVEQTSAEPSAEAAEPSAEAAAPAESQSAETPAATEEAKPAETAQAPEAAAPPPAPAETYTAKAGDTLKSIARKLYGKTNKLAALSSANPGVKPATKLKAGQVIRLPEPPKP